MSALQPLAPFFGWLARQVDDSLAAGVLSAFLAHCLSQYQLVQHTIRLELPGEIADEWFVLSEFKVGKVSHGAAGMAGTLPAGAGLPLRVDPIFAPLRSLHTGEGWILELTAWAASLPKGLVITAGGIAPGSILRLLALQALDDPAQSTLIAANLESLLRHVEVKRQACLPLLPPAPGQPPHPKSTTCLERSTLSLLFSRVSRRSGDLRFFNTALKLNDWGYPDHRRQPLSAPCLPRYLRAVAEAENLLMEFD